MADSDADTTAGTVVISKCDTCIRLCTAFNHTFIGDQLNIFVIKNWKFI